MGAVPRTIVLVCLSALVAVRAAPGQPPPAGFPLTRLPPVGAETVSDSGRIDSAASWGATGSRVATAAEVQVETLQAAWTLALSADQQLMACGAEVESAAAALGAATAQRHPLLGVSADYTVRDSDQAFRIDSPLVPYAFDAPFWQRENLAFAGRVDVPLYTGGRVTGQIDAARCGVRALELRRDRYRLELAWRVSEEYVAVLRAEQEVAVAASHELSLSAHAHDTELLHAQERVPRNDLLAAQVALADAQHQVIKARSELDACRAAYNRRLGRPLTMPVALAALEVPAVPADVEALTQQALTLRPELAELDAEAMVRRHRADVAAAARRAQVHLQGAYTFHENQYQTPQGITSAGVGVWWNLYDGGRANYQAQEQAQQAQATAHLRADLQSLIQLEVRRAWLELGQTRQRLTVTEQSIARAEENLRVTRQRYTTGMATNTDVLAAESLRVQTYRNHHNAHYDATLAELRLQRAVGTLGITSPP